MKSHLYKIFNAPLLITLVFYLLIKLPLIFSVLCGNTNEGYYFIYGNYLFSEYFPRLTGSVLFTFIYALIVKTFGFNGYSIVVVHVIQSVIQFVIGLLIYSLLLKLTKSNKFSLIGFFLWFILTMLPLGGWGCILEQNAFNGLEKEYFISLFSLISLLYFHKAWDEYHYRTVKKYFIYAAIFSVLPIFFKASGLILILTYISYVLFLIIFDRESLMQKKEIFYYFIMPIVVLCLVSFIVFCYLSGGAFEFWRGYFLIGSYHTKFLSSFQDLLNVVNIFLSRGLSIIVGINNISILLFSYVGALISIVINVKNRGNYSGFFILLAIWMIGNTCVVLAPGSYGSYYYIVLYPSICIFFALFFLFIHENCKNKPFNIFSKLIIIFFSILLIARFYVSIPGCSFNLKNNWNAMLFFQNESLRNSVTNTRASNDNLTFKFADHINKITKENDRIYFFMYSTSCTFTQDFYIYARRLPHSTVLSDHLLYKHIKYLENWLKEDFIINPPELIIIPYNLGFLESTPQPVEFLKWLNKYMVDKYKLIDKVTLNVSSDRSEQFLIFRYSPSM